MITGFALADIFLKRALALTLLVGVVLALHVTVGIRWLATDTATPTGAPLTAYLLALALFSAAAYDRIRRVSAWFVDTVLLRQARLRRTAVADRGRTSRIEEQPEAILRFVSNGSRRRSTPPGCAPPTFARNRPRTRSCTAAPTR